MDMGTSIKVAGLVLLFCIIALPAAFFITVITFPVWRWSEEISGIESFGHSGPAEWCYWFVYIFLLVSMAFIFNKLKNKTDK